MNLPDKDHVIESLISQLNTYSWHKRQELELTHFRRVEKEPSGNCYENRSTTNDFKGA
jgi:hypothetical protein